MKYLVIVLITFLCVGMMASKGFKGNKLEIMKDGVVLDGTETETKSNDLIVYAEKVEPKPTSTTKPTDPLDVQSMLYVHNATYAEKINKNLGGVLKNKGETFCLAGQVYGVDPILGASIAKHETGNGTSKAIRNLNNVGGIMDTKTGKLRHFKNGVEESIFEMFRLLKYYYIDNGISTIEQIQKKYCPIGALNDPTHLNKNWKPAVKRNYQQIIETEI
jgi:hypothetical protein